MSEEVSNWDSYFWEPGGDVLRNRLNAREPLELAFLEYRETFKRQRELEDGVVDVARTYDAQHLRAVHRHLFQNVYDWAGEYRTVNMSKGGDRFADVDHIEVYLGHVGQALQGEDVTSLSVGDFAVRASFAYALVNQAHPFREGNGRASKVFMNHVAQRSGFELDWAAVPPAVWNEAAHRSAPAPGEVAPRPEALLPVFLAIAQRPAAGIRLEPAATSPTLAASYPRSARDVVAGAPLIAQEYDRPYYAPSRDRGDVER